MADMSMGYSILFPILTVAGFGLAFGIVLSIMAKKFAPEVNELEGKINSMMPGANCGACGYAGCSGYAREMAGKGVDPSKCPVLTKEQAREISIILGLEGAERVAKVAAVQCQGGRNSYFRASYSGVMTCAAEVISAPGRNACEWGCIGHGDCCDVCPFDAIRMGEDAYPVVDFKKCTGCGKCVAACPKGIITLIPEAQNVFLGCRNPLKGKDVKDACSRGCIGCRLCATPKITPSGKVVMKGNLPEVPADWQDFDQAVLKCPGQCFVLTAGKPVPQEAGV
jgi:Na+-translocating ferredoxin:NAD+ oxidoreductase RNF subunit RnfB